MRFINKCLGWVQVKERFKGIVLVSIHTPMEGADKMEKEEYYSVLKSAYDGLP